MSVTPAPWGLSNPGLKPWVITVVVIVVITWRLAANVVTAYTDVLGLMAALHAWHIVRPRSTAAAQTSTRHD